MVDETSGDDALVQEEPLKTTGESADFPGGKRSTADAIREHAGKLGSQAAEKAKTYAGEGKEKATGALDEVAKLVRNAAGDIDERLGADYGKYAHSAAEGISGLADKLRGREVDDLIDDVTTFVKKSPVIAVGTAAAIGFVLARLIKSGVDAAADLADRDDKSPSDKA